MSTGDFATTVYISFIITRMNVLSTNEAFIGLLPAGC
jgi:hypothetical protein